MTLGTHRMDLGKSLLHLRFGFLTKRTLAHETVPITTLLKLGSGHCRGGGEKQLLKGNLETLMAGTGPRTLMDDRKDDRARKHFKCGLILLKGKDIARFLKPNSPVYSSSIIWE